MIETGERGRRERTGFGWGVREREDERGRIRGGKSRREGEKKNNRDGERD